MPSYIAEHNDETLGIEANRYESAMDAAVDHFGTTYDVHVTQVQDGESIDVYSMVTVKLTEGAWNCKLDIHRMNGGSPEQMPFKSYNLVDEVVLFGAAFRHAAGEAEIQDVTVRVREFDNDGERACSIEIADKPTDLNRGQ